MQLGVSQASLSQYPLSEPLPRTAWELHTHGAATHPPLLHCQPCFTASPALSREPSGSHSGAMLPTSPQFCTPDLHSRLSFCLAQPFPFFLPILQSLPRGLSESPAQAGAQSWGIFLIPEHVFAGHITLGEM